MKIVVLASRCKATNIVVNYLRKHCEISTVILENPIPKLQLIKRRIKKLGIFKVCGQVLFRLVIVPFLAAKSRTHIANIMSTYELNDCCSYIDESKTIYVDSANNMQCVRLLQEIDPDVVIVNGTRILSKQVLTCCKAKFINLHTGITPQYRGVHGGYWALVMKDRENCGVTVHLVDQGIDTGGVLYQARIFPTAEDNFLTYPLLQLAAGLPLEILALQDVADGGLCTLAIRADSKLYTHPTLLQYLENWVSMGVK